MDDFEERCQNAYESEVERERDAYDKLDDFERSGFSSEYWYKWWREFGGDVCLDESP